MTCLVSFGDIYVDTLCQREKVIVWSYRQCFATKNKPNHGMVHVVFSAFDMAEIAQDPEPVEPGEGLNRLRCITTILWTEVQ